MAYSREDHGETQAIGGGNDLFIPYGAAGLDGSRSTNSCNSFKAVGEREVSVGGGDCALEGEDSFLSAEFGGIDAAGLAGADTYGLAVPSVDDGV